MFIDRTNMLISVYNVNTYIVNAKGQLEMVVKGNPLSGTFGIACLEVERNSSFC